MKNQQDHNHDPAMPPSLQSGVSSAVPTMSTREIAELTGKEHRNVMRDTRAMLEQMGEGGVLRFEHTHRNEQKGQEYAIFRLPKRECMILVSGYDLGLRTRIIDRWMELEASRPAFDPLALLNDPAAMRGLLLGYSEKVLALEADKAAMAPKVEAHDRIAESYGTFCRSTAAKMLGVPPQTLCRWMRTNDWTFRRPGDKDDIAYQGKINSGLLEHKITTGLKEDGTEWSSTQVRVTPKGITALAKAFPPAAVAA